MNRKPYLAGNWKMNLERRTALDLVGALREHVGSRDDVDVAVLPPFVYLPEVIAALEGSPVMVGAQNLCAEASGAFTGEVSGAMLQDIGCDFVLIGHSERRHVYGESDELIQRKLRHALDLGMDVILALGETLEERQGGSTEAVVKRQLASAAEGVSAAEFAKVTLAYEPVWAIGTGLTATPEQAGEVHTYLRGLISGLYDEQLAERTRIQYGGSVKPSNAAELMAVDGVDGALVGGASLEADSFTAIIDFDR